VRSSSLLLSAGKSFRYACQFQELADGVIRGTDLKGSPLPRQIQTGGKEHLKRRGGEVLDNGQIEAHVLIGGQEMLRLSPDCHCGIRPQDSGKHQHRAPGGFEQTDLKRLQLGSARLRAG
jgi:hypothetical protein